ncbi:MAG: hypothetical protein OXU21_08560, partial [Chloroflexota bacterium]|nr:hypothetical protein [Chloroflexota bacterium]
IDGALGDLESASLGHLAFPVIKPHMRGMEPGRIQAYLPREGKRVGTTRDKENTSKYNAL